jgi:hypothetical protein
VYVRAARLEARALVEALDRGDFYASPALCSTIFGVDAKTMTVTVKPDTWA